MENSENTSQGSVFKNDTQYAFAPHGVHLGSFVRTGEPMNRMYHVFDKNGEEVGHASRYRYVAAFFAVFVQEYMQEKFAEQEAEVAAASMIADLEKFLENPEGQTNG